MATRPSLHQVHRCLYSVLGLMTSLACSTSSGVVPVANTPDQAGAILPGTVIAVGGAEHAAIGVYTLQLDPAALSAQVVAHPRREMSQNDDVFLLSVDAFMTSTRLEVTEIEVIGSELSLSYEVSHPFPAPANPSGTQNASTNRADLGITGYVCFLADVPTATGQTFFTDRVVNTSLVSNADAYYSPGGLITGNTIANTFPCKLLVDESGATGSRVGISNGGVATGNYGADGWTRAEFGTGNTGWTGYGFLAQGQSSANQVGLSLSELTANNFRIDLAVLAKYNDPRGGSTSSQKIANRLPPATADHTKFAYRMPHGALDGGQIVPGPMGGGFQSNIASSATLSFHVMDWDARSIATTQNDLSLESAVTKVAPGESGLPQVDVCIPGVLGNASAVTPIASVVDDDTTWGGDAAQDSGQSGDLLFFSGPVSKPAASGQSAGTYTGLVRVTDAQVGGYIALDPNLAPLGTPPDAKTYQIFEVIMDAASGWGVELGTVDPRDIAADPAGLSYTVGSFSGTYDFDPGPGVASRTAAGAIDGFCLALDAAGAFLWCSTWGRVGAQVFPFSVDLDPNSTPRIAGNFRQASVDFDPGAGTSIQPLLGFSDGFVLALNASGTFVGVSTWGGAGAAAHEYSKLAVGANGEVRVVGTFEGTVDFDPGVGSAPRTAGVGSIDSYCLALTALGVYQWSHQSDPGIDSLTYAQYSAIAVDVSGNLCLGGRYQGTIDLDPGAGTAMRTANAPAWDAFCLALTGTGGFRWVSTYGGPFVVGTSGDEDVHDLDFTPKGAPILCGTYSSNCDFDPGPGVALRSSDQGLGYCLALTEAGAFLGVNVLDAGPRDIAIDADGQPRVLGIFDDTVDFDAGSGTVHRTALGLPDIYCQALSAGGDHQWVATWGGTAYDTPEGIALDATGNVYLCGKFANDTDFDPGPGTDIRTTPGTDPLAFVIQLSADGTY